MVGEIGIPREDFLHNMQWWEIRSVIRGYERRKRDPLSIVRWHAYNIMAAMPYCDLKKAGIHTAEDLLQFSWEKDEQRKNMFTPEELAEIDKMLNANRQGND